MPSPWAWALLLVLGAPALVQAQLFPNMNIRRQRPCCAAEDPRYRIVREQYFGYYPTCWRRFPPGWGCPSPDAPDWEKAKRDLPLQLEPLEEGAEQPPLQERRGTAPGEPAMPELPREEGSLFEREPARPTAPGATPPGATPPGATPGARPVPGGPNDPFSLPPANPPAGNPNNPTTSAPTPAVDAPVPPVAAPETNSAETTGEPDSAAADGLADASVPPVEPPPGALSGMEETAAPSEPPDVEQPFTEELPPAPPLAPPGVSMHLTLPPPAAPAAGPMPVDQPQARAPSRPVRRGVIANLFGRLKRR